MMTFRLTAVAIAALISSPGLIWSQDRARGQTRCHGGENERRERMMRDDDRRKDTAEFHFLLDHRDQIRRTVTELPDGVETLTESDVPEVADAIRTHVRSMYRRLKEGRPIHRRDPLFAEIFAHKDAIEMAIEETARGLRVRETSSDPYVVELIQSHARVVSAFIENGRAEMRKNHALPERN